MLLEGSGASTASVSVPSAPAMCHRKPWVSVNSAFAGRRITRWPERRGALFFTTAEARANPTEAAGGSSSFRHRRHNAAAAAAAFLGAAAGALRAALVHTVTCSSLDLDLDWTDEEEGLKQAIGPAPAFGKTIVRIVGVVRSALDRNASNHPDDRRAKNKARKVSRGGSNRKQRQLQQAQQHVCMRRKCLQQSLEFPSIAGTVEQEVHRCVQVVPTCTNQCSSDDCAL